MFKKIGKNFFTGQVFVFFIVLNSIFISNYRCQADMQGEQYQISGDNMNVFDSNNTSEKRGTINKNGRETDKKAEDVLSTNKDKEQKILNKTDWGIYKIGISVFFTVSAIVVLFFLQKIFKDNQKRKKGLLYRKN